MVNMGSFKFMENRRLFNISIFVFDETLIQARNTPKTQSKMKF